MLPDFEEFESFLERIDFKSTFWGVHYDRYVETYRAIQKAGQHGASQDAFLELGNSWVFSTFLKNQGGFSRVDVTEFNNDKSSKIRYVRSQFDKETDTIYRSFSVNLEAENIPVDDETYGLILCCELVEHLDVDPMFMMSEINRILKPGGFLVMSTPNSTCSSLVDRILKGYSPQFYMFYQKDRSPFRHNFEYAPHQIKQLVDASGFEMSEFWTADTFGTKSLDAMRYLEEGGFPTSERGDNMFVVAKKVSGITDRYPNSIYDNSF